jgi:scaffold protein FimL
VAHSEEINLNSLALVRGELVAEVEDSASQLERFVADRDNAELLQGCIEGIEKISGTLNLIQLYGASLLASELLALAKDIAPGENDTVDHQLEILSSGFFILPRYLEYVQQTRRGTPVLLITYINELRQARNETPLPESYFFEVDLGAKYTSKASSSSMYGNEMPALIRRLRHMYQVGLLNLLQGKQAKSALGLMQRALERLEIICGDRPIGKLWWLAVGALESMSNDGVTLSKPRKQVLMVLDRQIKLLQAEGAAAFDREPPEVLVKSLIYWVALGGSTSERGQAVHGLYQYEPLTYSATELSREEEALKGPSANTVASVAAVLHDELRSTKEILENASQGGTEIISDYDELIDTLAKVSDILAVVGLTAAGNTLKQEISRIEGWRDSGESGDAKDLLEVADALLYVESTVSGLDQLHLSDDKLSRVNSITRSEVIASSQLAEAEMVVITEAEAGLALVKRALNSYAESNFDRGHIKNVAASLHGVRGGMIVLHLDRAARVVAACAAFIEDSLLQNDHPAALQQMLETFADAIIGLEYYLDAIKSDKDADDSVLEIAEESLQALGFRV